MTDALAEPVAPAARGVLRLLDRIRRTLRARRAGRALARGLKAHERQRHRAAFRHFAAAARAGDREAQYRLGLLYRDGQGVLRHPPDAVSWFRRAAQQGHLDAQFQLSLAYLYGPRGAFDQWYQVAEAYDRRSAEWNRDLWFPAGVSLERDYQEAFRWSLLAAEQGLAEAQANVGSLYLRGLGCKSDYEEARRWCELAAAQGNGEAAYGLGMIYANGLGVPVDLGAAAQWYETAAQAGNDAAQLALGLMYASGQGVSCDTASAAILFRHAAEGGNSRARHNLGLLHLRGEGLPQDNAAAEACFREAARAGYAPAMLSLGQMCERGEHSAAGLAEAVLWYKAAAEAGNAEAQFVLGRLYARGDSLPLRLDEAAKWFQRAAEQGHAAAQFNIAALHMQGTGVALDHRRAMEWYGRAAKQGLTSAQVRLAHLQLVDEGAPGSQEDAITWLRQAADRGDSEAETALAVFYLRANDGMRDLALAARLLRRAAERGHAPACLELCRLVAAGQLSDVPPAEAVQWHRTAAAAGHAEAQLLLARDLFLGIDCPRDPAAAASWLEKAAEQGNVSAQFELAALYYQGEGVPRDRQTALKWYRLAAEQGSASAQHNLAEMLLKGEGIEQDTDGAVAWLTKAAEQGLAEAQCALGDLALEGRGMPSDREAARGWYEKAAAHGHAEALAKLAAFAPDGKLASDVPTPPPAPIPEIVQPDPLSDRQIESSPAASGEPVRLVIWDLDETFWDGTLSEGGLRAYLQKNHDIVVTLAERGIMSSICSKNDRDGVRQILEEHGIWEYFIFPSIDWTAKGQRIAAIIEDVQLRPPSVLFIDDNPANRAEAAALVPGIQTADTTLLPALLDDPRVNGKDDRQLTRLQQYKLLEQRHTSRAAAGEEPEAFLRSSNIRITIDAEIAAHLDRAVELINRTNQLNFTKVRLPEDFEEGRAALLAEIEPYYVQAGLVHVVDNYGDYGYCGFYLLNGSQLVHYCFSCRILGMGVETWLYERLGRPDIAVAGEVLTDLAAPREIDWINVVTTDDAGSEPQNHWIPEIRLRGGCDLDALAHYFRLVSASVRVETNQDRPPLFVHLDSSLQIVPSVSEMPAAFVPAIERLGYAREDFASEFLAPASPGSVFIYSPWADVYVSIYRHKTHGFAVPVTVHIYSDLTAITDDVLSKSLKELRPDTADERKIREIVSILRAEYEHEPWVSVSEAMNILGALFRRIPADSRLFVILPHEWERLDGVLTPRQQAIDYNAAVRELAQEYPAVTLMAMDDVVHAPEEVQEDFDHFDRIVYFRMYRSILEEIERDRRSTAPGAGLAGSAAGHIEPQPAPAA